MGQDVTDTIKEENEAYVYRTGQGISSYPGLPLSTIFYPESQSQSRVPWLVYTAKDSQFYEGKAEDSITLAMRNKVCEVNPSTVKYDSTLQGFNLSDVVNTCPNQIRFTEIEITSGSIRHEIWEDNFPVG